ncbi:MAG: Cytochrome c, class I [Anaerolineales bacterium]|nr:Cytochrome c, class I [Anaerolineales bacterium]
MKWLLASRWRVFFIALAFLLVLDMGRSRYAHSAAARPPYDDWNGEPYDLKLAAWPPSANVPADASPGQKIYIERCAVCHGTDGDGKGVAAPSIYPRPRDFAEARQEELEQEIHSLPASPMPYFRDLLTEDEITAVVEYLKGFSPVFAGAAPESMAIPPRVLPDDASLARGKTLFEANCASCHGADGRARLTLKDSNGYEIHARDLTAPWTFRGGSAPEQLWLRVTHGLAPSPMPSFADKLTENERWDVVNYVLSLARVAPWAPGGKLDSPRDVADPVKRGEYIAHTEICGLCHTPINRSGIYRGDDYYLAGGMRVGAYPHATFVSRNLTADPETGLGDKSVDEIAGIIRNGRASDRTLNFWGMPWMFLHSLTEDDARAVAAYLKTLPPVKNDEPAPVEYGFVETLVMKLARGLPVAAPEVLTYADGNYARPASPGLLPLDWPQRGLVAAQWIVLVGGLGLWIVAGPRERRLPATRRSWVLTALAVVGVALAALVASVLANLPKPFPPDIIAEQVLGSLPEPDPAAFQTPEALALAQRGEYIYASASCAFCHGTDGAGGAKINWSAMGTIWTRNISSDVETGLGAWSDAEIARAIRSGVSRDGRQLHWQGMTWDHFANFDEEDVRAVIAYLRILPPVEHEIPIYSPPSPDDCSIYTFWTVPDNFTPGCK